MRFRRSRCAGFLVFATILAAGGSNGQPPAPPKVLPPEVLAPTPIGPSAKGVLPAAAAAPARKPTPFDRFRKYDELPDLTRELVLSTQRGMEWLSREGIHRPNGRFIPGLDPALGKPTEDDQFIRQALGAFALARAARLTGDEKYAVRAGQTILSLLAETKKDATRPDTRTPVQPNVVCNRVGAAAHLALAIYELPDSSDELRQCGEELCLFLRSRIKDDGSVQYMDPGEAADPAGEDLYPGPTLAALAMSHRTAPAAWKQDALARGLSYYRKQFRTAPRPGMTPWLTAAFADMHLQTKEPAYAEGVFEMTDWMVKLQYENPDRQRAAWRGGFPTVADGKVTATAPTVETAAYALGLADACRMIRNMDRPDAARYDRYRVTLTRALQFLSTLQYAEDNTQHFAGHFRPALVGAFHPSATDGTLRVDHTAVAVAALCQFLIAGADR